MVFLDLFLDDLVADVPIGVIVPGVSAWVKERILVFGDWMIGKSQLDLRVRGCTLRSFCSWVYSF